MGSRDKSASPEHRKDLETSLDSDAASQCSDGVEAAPSLLQKLMKDPPGDNVPPSMDQHLGDLENLLDDKSAFVSTPCPRDLTVHCRITRDEKRKKYYLLLERGTNNNLFLLGARRSNFSSRFRIYKELPEMLEKTDSYVGKIKASCYSTCFTVYDGGKNPTKKCDPADFRCEIAAIIYENRPKKPINPRNLHVIIPTITQDNNWFVVKPENEEEVLVNKWKFKNMENCMKLISNSPIKKAETGNYELEFNGRVTCPSVKNLQIIQEGKGEEIVMQFGRVAADVFTMDYSYPLCALQAFSIALSSFTYQA